MPAINDHFRTFSEGPAFAGPARFVERATQADPSSERVAAWRIGQGVSSAPAAGAPWPGPRIFAR